MNDLILVVEDSPTQAESLKYSLEKLGYIVDIALDGVHAMQWLENNTPCVVISDIIMPGMDGYEFCKTVRADKNWKSVPIIFLSVKSDELDKILGLELGADDYLTKPFSVKELISRIKAVLRRTESSPQKGLEEKVIRYRGIELYPEKFQVSIDNKDIKLTKTEFELLHLFLSHPGKIFSRDNIIDSVRGSDIYITDRTVDVHIMNLRKKFENQKNLISTFSGVGYGIK